jgi:hypothetical protein
VTVNSKEENSEDFCPNYIQEFGLRRGKRNKEGVRNRKGMIDIVSK